VDELILVLRGERDDWELDRAALEVARFEHPCLRPEPYLAMLDSFAAELDRRTGRGAGGRLFVAAAGEYLFSELGFTGNREHYYDPANSCLNEVLTSRRGIPITLSVIYLEVARRLGRRAHGIGLPGHFLVRYDDGGYSVFVDAFDGGRVLTPAECFVLARQATGAPVEEDPRLLAPVSKRQILTRMLSNLRNAYRLRQAYGKALRVLEVLRAAHPGSDEFDQEARTLKRYLARWN